MTNNYTKGGRGKAAPYATETARIVSDLRETVEALNDAARSLYPNCSPLMDRVNLAIQQTCDKFAVKTCDESQSKTCDKLNPDKKEDAEIIQNKLLAIYSLIEKWDVKSQCVAVDSPRWYFARKLLSELKEVIELS